MGTVKTGETRVLCVDDHPILAEGLRARLERTQDIKYVGCIATAEQLDDVVGKTQADVVVMDVALPGTDPFEAVDNLRRQHPDVRVVFLSAHVRDHYLDESFRCGAWGYLYKGDDLNEIVEAVRRVARGEYVFSASVLERRTTGRPLPTAPSSRLKDLTPRELQVLRLIGRGMSRQEIADTLHRSVKTIDTHRTAILEKLELHDRSDLILFALREGVAELEG